MNNSTPSLRIIGFDWPEEIAMIASIDYKGGEKDPTVELALYLRDFDAGEPDSRLTGEGNLGRLKLRQFFACGCGMIIENDKIVFTESGLQNFIGKNITDHGNIIIVWQKEAKKIDLKRSLELMRQLSNIFC